MTGNANSQLKIFFTGSAISLIGMAILGLLNFLIRRKFALSLSVEDFGFLYSALALCSVFLAYLDIGLGQSCTILISKSIASGNNPKAKSYYIHFFLFKLIGGLFVFFCLAVTYRFWMNDFFKYNNPLPYFIIVLLLVIQSVSSAPTAVISALKKFTIKNIGLILNPLAIFIIIYFIYTEPEITIAASTFVIGISVLFLFEFAYVHKFGYKLRLKALKEKNIIPSMLHLSKWVAISTACLSTMYYMDTLMLTYLKGLKSVALYNIALPIMQIAQSMLVFPAVFLPIVSDLWEKHKLREISNIAKLIMSAIAYLLWPIMVTIILTSKILIILIFSSKFTSAAPALIILFGGMIFFCLGNFFMGTLNAGKRPKNVALTIIIACILNIILNTGLIPFFDICGAASATALSYILITIILFFVMRKELKSFYLPIKDNIYTAIIGLICIIAAIYFYSEHGYLKLITIAIIINTAYLILTIPKLRKIYSNMLKIWHQQ